MWDERVFNVNEMDFTKKVKKVLLEIGLTEIQADFYLFLLKTGGSTVSHVAKSLSINRTNSYAILEKLRTLDLVSEENKITGKVIYAKSYEPIVSALEEKEKEVSDLKQTIHSLAPIFTSFSSSSSLPGPKIRTYESKREFDYLLEDILAKAREGKEILLYSNQATERGIFSKKAHDDFIRIRVENGIKIKVLTIDNEEGRALVPNDKKFLRETRILPPSFDFTAEIYIYDNKITMVDMKEDLIGVIIESPELYKIHEQTFMMIWDACTV
jgi:sugar-specific transcriptional regulator TrmB